MLLLRNFSLSREDILFKRWIPLKILTILIIIMGTYLLLISFSSTQKLKINSKSLGGNALLMTEDKKQYLSHLIIPLHIKQKERMKGYFEKWKMYPPCEEEKNEKYNLFAARPTEKIKIVLQVSSEAPITDQDRKDLVEHYYQEGVKSKCFASIEIKELIIRNDSYLTGSRVMFESMLSNEMGLVNPTYIFYMEPDCKPIRSGWLQAVDAAIRWPNAHFWMKGSPYRGKPTPNISNHLIVRSHINGNAIYNLGDPAFSSFYFDTVKPFIKKKFAIYGAAYDLDFFRLFYNSTGEFYYSFQHLLTKFQYSEVIQNHWHSVYRLRDLLENSLDTFIIHGGTAEDII
jgi:hypothetical protein